MVINSVLPVHPYTGLTAIGILPSGRPVWPVIGAAPDDDSDGDGSTGDADLDTEVSDDEAAGKATDPPEGEGGEEGDDDKPLGEKGEKALAAEKEKRKSEAARRRAAEKENKRLQAELEEARKALPKPPAEPQDKKDTPPADPAPEPVDPEEIRRQVREEMQTEAARDRVLDKIEVGAAKLFADPSDAAALLLRGKELDDFLDGGKPDVEAIQEALEDLLKKKPYLGVPAQGGKRFQGSGDGGAKPVKPQRSRSLGEAVNRALTPK